jgi:hypothetical protein
MAWRVLVACLAVVLLAGCGGLVGDDRPDSTVEVSIQNQGSSPVDVTVTVADPAGDVVATDEGIVDPDVARSVEFSVTGDGRYRATVQGQGFEVNVAWTAGMCSRYRGEVVVSGTTADSRGECVAAA